MKESNFEGTLVLEKLAQAGKVADFFEAVDDDNFERAKALMMAADIDIHSITVVLLKMNEANEDDSAINMNDRNS